jgi:serine/threonine protein kinase
MKIAGTPQYMCPELINKKRYDPYKADIWAFGILLYWMVLGYYPQDNSIKKTKRDSKTQNNF